MKDSPIFVYSFNGIGGDNNEYLKRIKDISLIDDKQIYIITYISKKIKIKLPNNINVIYVDDDIMNSTTANIAKNINYILHEQLN